MKREGTRNKERGAEMTEWWIQLCISSPEGLHLESRAANSRPNVRTVIKIRVLADFLLMHVLCEQLRFFAFFSCNSSPKWSAMHRVGC